MKKSTKYFDCGICNSPLSLKLTIKETKFNVEQKVYKCTDCKHQYGFKGLLKLNEVL